MLVPHSTLRPPQPSQKFMCSFTKQCLSKQTPVPGSSVPHVFQCLPNPSLPTYFKQPFHSRRATSSFSKYTFPLWMFSHSTLAPSRPPSFSSSSRLSSPVKIMSRTANAHLVHHSSAHHPPRHILASSCVHIAPPCFVSVLDSFSQASSAFLKNVQNINSGMRKSTRLVKTGPLTGLVTWRPASRGRR